MRSNESNTSPANLSEATESGADLSPGQQLIRAREAAGLNQEELAARLCMTATKLDHLEQDDYERLSGATYAKGYIRNVCKELKLDPAPVLAAFEQRLPAESEPLVAPAKGPVVGAGGGTGGIRFAPVALVALITVGGGYWWFAQGQSGTQQFASTSSAEPVMAEEVAMAQEPVASVEPFSTAAEASVAVEDTNPDSEALSPEPELAVDPASAPEEGGSEAVADAVASAPVVPVVDSQVAAPEESEAPAPEESAPVMGGAELTLVFSEESWVEVSDARGDKLLAKLQPAGSRVELSGEAPFSLMLGNAAGTTVSYQGEVVDSAPRGNRRTRKLTVGG
ncbi:RodZ domain-containing protein [Microbulbifer celer]|uniref:RodZ domain-containing protein n=1 Tax=Microbulbifer celer TaxID=435905 RepID=A0ABW3U367_9GAMM|nr:RodZ domain-containing protein [Microbulbifer celer]UFN58054.1 DUF4115 domain-containing protein [Microbulbifer celer]